MLLIVLLPILFQVLTEQMTSAQCIPCNRISPSQLPLSPLLSPQPGIQSPLSAAISPIAVAEAMGFPRGFSPSFRCGFVVQSAPPMFESGLSIRSQNAYEGPLLVGGRLPFLSAVAVEGTLPSVGAGGVLYGCAAKDFGMVKEEIGPVPGAGILGAPGLYSGYVV